MKTRLPSNGARAAARPRRASPDKNHPIRSITRRSFLQAMSFCAAALGLPPVVLLAEKPMHGFEKGGRRFRRFPGVETSFRPEDSRGARRIRGLQVRGGVRFPGSSERGRGGRQRFVS
jgi:hypothetical protein